MQDDDEKPIAREKRLPPWHSLKPRKRLGRPRIPMLFERIVQIEATKKPPPYPARCPFCGCVDVRIHTRAGEKAVECHGCNARGPSADSVTEATKLWRYGTRERDDE